jgi:hypothetical protein
MTARPLAAALRPALPSASAVAAFAALALLAQPLPARAQKTAPYDGFLCCSMLSNGSWISDQNYDDGSKNTVPAGTPVKFTGFGRWRLLVEIEGKKLGIGNDYSRTIDMDTFAARYVLKDDPGPKLNAMPPKVREAVLKRKVMRGMTREQVIMALGYPTTSSTPDTTKHLWNYQFRSGEFQVFFTDDWKVDLLFGVPESRAKVWVE